MSKTANAVKDGSKMTDEQLGMLTRRFDELKKRINAGTITFNWAVGEVQRVIEAKFHFPFRIKIRLGIHNLKTTLWQALEKDGSISDQAGDILKVITLSGVATVIELVIVSVAELGFKSGAIRKDIYERAFSLGLELCPAEVGPQLRLQYSDMLMGEWLLIAMEPITGSSGIASVFDVSRNSGGMRLGTRCDFSNRVSTADRRWVFARRK